MRERLVEAELKRLAAAVGGRSLKWASPGLRGVPDQIVLMPISSGLHRDVVARYLRFVEVKCPDADLTAQQLERHAELRALGFQVATVDTLLGCRALLGYWNSGEPKC